MKVTEVFLQHLRRGITSGHLMTDPSDCKLYSYDQGRHHALPEAVVYARNTQEVRHIVKCCSEAEVPLVARGLGSGKPGGSVPIQGGVVLSLEKMDKLLETNFADKYIKVEAGIVNQTVQDIAEKKGFFWAPDPGSSAISTIGGNIGYNAAGPRSVKYGTTREHVLGLTAVIGTGEIIHTGTYTTKGAVGYDLTRLLIGSEGTLGIITEAILKLTPLSHFRNTLQVLYQDIFSATQAVINIMNQPHLPSGLELLDETCTKLMQHPTIGCMLLIDIDDPESKEFILEAIKINGLLEVNLAENKTDIQQIWARRKKISPELKAICPYKVSEDVVVPVSQMPELLLGLNKISQKYNIPIVNFGHAGNGNIHVNLLTESADKYLSEIFDLVISLKGTLSGEHGIGIEKRPYIPKAIDAPTLNIMKQIKKTFDPKSILNPGKIFPD